MNHSLETDKHAQVMGILNITPDSFSDGGKFVTEKQILSQVKTMVEAGADIVDVGGESTRPFAQPVEVDEELNRVIPAIQIIRQHYTIPLSIDTTKAEVARRAIEAGADIINDISALRFDQEMIAVVRDHNVPVIIMHMQGTPADMQINPEYGDVMTQTVAFLQERIDWATERGVNRDRIIIDPGIGFGKTVTHNLTILKHLADLKKLNCPILVGHSRKSFIGKILDNEADDRDMVSAALSAICIMSGASIVRVHDVGKTVQTVRLAEAILDSP